MNMRRITVLLIVLTSLIGFVPADAARPINLIPTRVDPKDGYSDTFTLDQRVPRRVRIEVATYDTTPLDNTCEQFTVWIGGAPVSFKAAPNNLIHNRQIQHVMLPNWGATSFVVSPWGRFDCGAQADDNPLLVRWVRITPYL